MKGKLAEMYEWPMVTATATQQAGFNYYNPYWKYCTQSPLYDSDGDESSRRYFRSESPPTSHRQTQESNPLPTMTGIQEQPPFLKRILVVDDEPDVSLTFKSGLEAYLDQWGRKMFEVHVYDSPLKALSDFRANLYDLLLTDVYMPGMNGFELSQKILELDLNVRICYISAAEVHIEALRELYPTLSLGCFIKKPVDVEYLAKRLSAEIG
jgi:CheY-like chemotaxis protein